MSIGEKGICVRILEKEFRVACPPNQEQALRDAALYLDKQMRQIRQTGRVIGIERIAVMAALNIANELLAIKSTEPVPGKALSERLKLLQEKIDCVLSHETLSKESVDENGLTTESRISAARNRLQQFSQECELKEK
jgi:cell division protein ZapA